MYHVISFIDDYFTSSPKIKTVIVPDMTRDEAEEYANLRFTIIAPADLPRVLGVYKGRKIKTWDRICGFKSKSDAVEFARALTTPRKWVFDNDGELYLRIKRNPIVDRAIASMPNRVKPLGARYAKIIVNPCEWPLAEKHPRFFRYDILKYA